MREPCALKPSWGTFHASLPLKWLPTGPVSEMRQTIHAQTMSAAFSRAGILGFVLTYHARTMRLLSLPRDSKKCPPMGPQRVVKPYNSKQETFSVRNELCGHEPRFCNNMHIIKIELSGSWLLRLASLGPFWVSFHQFWSVWVRYGCPQVGT